jgi:hypothetical protein
MLFRPGGNTGRSGTLPYPSLVVRCSGVAFSYQNELTAMELSYWLRAVCLRELPQCG